MFGIDDAIIGGGISALGSLAGGFFSSQGASSANAANERIAQANRDWQERMSNTAYQRSMKDMREAGLNPILAGSVGGASTPPGNVATMVNAMEGLGQGIHSASKVASTVAELQNLKATTANTVSQEKLNEASTNLSNVNAVKANQETATSAAVQRRTDAEAALVNEQIKNPQAYRDLSAAQAHSASSHAQLTDAQRRDYEKYGPPGGWRSNMPVLDRVFNALDQHSKNRPVVPSPATHGFGAKTGAGEIWRSLTNQTPTSLKLPPRN